MASCGLGGRTGEGAIHSGRSPITASVDLAAEIVGVPRAEVPAERFSFVLHAPLVLMARSAHLPYVGLRLEGPLVSVPGGGLVVTASDHSVWRNFPGAPLAVGRLSVEEHKMRAPTWRR